MVEEAKQKMQILLHNQIHNKSLKTNLLNHPHPLLVIFNTIRFSYKSFF